jgi:carbonyl reductase 1
MNGAAIVTGANQGLGRALVAGIAARLGAAGSVYLTGRSSTRVATAAGELREAGLHIVTERVDVTSTDGVNRFAAMIARRHGQVDLVLSNAAARISRDLSQAEQVATFVDTNNLGTTRIIRAFAPLLAPGGRFLIVASDFGSLRNLPPQLHEHFDTDTLSLDELDAQMTRYAHAVEADSATAEGWPEWINIPSKIGQVAAMRILAHNEREHARQDGRFIAAVCPGLVDTDASRPWFTDMSQAQSPEEAAADILTLAFAPIEPSFYGELIPHRRIVPWR